MKLFNLFGKKADVSSQKMEEANDEEDLEIYSGMRVEVTAFDGVSFLWQS